MVSIESRLQRLERRARWLTLAALAGPFVGGATATWLQHSPRSLDVSRLVIADGKGASAELSGLEHGGFGLVLRDRNARPRALMALSSDGSPRVSLAGAGGETLAELTAYEDAAPRLALSNAEGNEFFRVSLEADGSAALSLADQEGRERAGLHASGDGSPTLALKDRLGGVRAELSVTHSGKPKLLLEGPDGKTFEAPLPTE